MSNAFRDLLKKIGSGSHTGQDLTRQEAASATRMMLLQEATPAQIGAFMIAHRIKRPTGEELAGMLDAYDELGPTLPSIAFERAVTIFCSPYDGRDRTMPLIPLTALILAAAGCPSILHGGRRMPTKEGVPLVDIWQGLGVDWTRLTLPQVQYVLERTGLGFIYLPAHFPLAHDLVPYREQIGKRPPFATLELMWSPYAGNAHVVTGFVHPPTEDMVRDAFARRGTTRFTTVKGLEGSCDLPRERTAIIGLAEPSDYRETEPGSNGATENSNRADQQVLNAHAARFDRLHLHARDYGFVSANVPLLSTPQAIDAMLDVLQGQPSELTQSVVWNSGFYLWRCGIGKTMAAAIATARDILNQGQAMQKLKEVREVGFASQQAGVRGK